MIFLCISHLNSSVAPIDQPRLAKSNVYHHLWTAAKDKESSSVDIHDIISIG